MYVHTYVYHMCILNVVFFYEFKFYRNVMATYEMPLEFIALLQRSLFIISLSKNEDFYLETCFYTFCDRENLKKCKKYACFYEINFYSVSFIYLFDIGSACINFEKLGFLWLGRPYCEILKYFLHFLHIFYAFSDFNFVTAIYIDMKILQIFYFLIFSLCCPLQV